MPSEIFFSDGYDPFRNLAAEEALFLRPAENAVLYLWQNENTVVIGKNQCAYTECRLPLLFQEGGRLARRSSGGGAVYHDLGNLNFTFVMQKSAYDVQRQLGVILSALASFGIGCAASGRNDITLVPGGEKVSGCAFRVGRERAYMHGTLLVSADMDKLSRYLAPPEAKYRAKGVASVRARVKNLSQINPAVTVDALRSALCTAFESEYGRAERRRITELNAAVLEPLAARGASDEWRLGRVFPCEAVLGARFSFGFMDFQFHLEDGVIADCSVFSDAMDTILPEAIAALLPKTPYTGEEIAARIFSLGTADAAEIAAFFRKKLV